MPAARNSAQVRTLTEGEVAAALRIERLELFLVASELRVGQFDPLTHLLMLSPADVERVAARLGVLPPKIAESEAKRGTEARKGVPEPRGE